MADVRLLGPWTFTLQTETPLYWLKCGPLSHYLLKLTIDLPAAENIYCGMVVHSPSESTGMEGASLWLEHKDGNKRYAVGGNDLKSNPVSSKVQPQTTPWREDWELLVQGYDGCWFLKNRTIRINFKLYRDCGCIAIFNSTKGSDDSSTDVLFKDVRLTVLSKAVRAQSAPILPSFPYTSGPKTANAPKKPFALQLGAPTTDERPSFEPETPPSCSASAASFGRPKSRPVSRAADNRTLEGRPAMNRPSTTPGTMSRYAVPQIGAHSKRAKGRNFLNNSATRVQGLPKGADFWSTPEFGSPKKQSTAQQASWPAQQSLMVRKKELQKELAVLRDLENQIAATYKALYNEDETHHKVSKNGGTDAVERLKKSAEDLQKYKESCGHRIRELQEEISIALEKEPPPRMRSCADDFLRSRVRSSSREKPAMRYK